MLESNSKHIPDATHQEILMRKKIKLSSQPTCYYFFRCGYKIPSDEKVIEK